MPTSPCCCTCLIFEDDFDSGSTLNTDYWNVISGTMTVDDPSDTAEIAAGSVVGPTTNLPGGSGGLEINIVYELDDLTIRFAYADANNHWRVDVSADSVNPGAIDTIMFKFYETVGGVEEYIGGREIPVSSVPFLTKICWYEGGRVSFLGPASFGATLEMYWPNHVSGGNSFRIEPAYDVTVDYVDWAQHILDHPDLSVPPCNCTTQECMWCDGEWGDTMLIEFLDGPQAGQTMTVDRRRDIPADGLNHESHATETPLSYWYFYYFSDDTDPDGFDWDVFLSFCTNTGGTEEPHDQGSISIQNSDPGGEDPQGSNDFTMADCEGPWEVVVDGVTVEITPSAP